jgi:hypothetical protein
VSTKKLDKHSVRFSFLESSGTKRNKIFPSKWVAKGEKGLNLEREDKENLCALD